MGITIFKVNFLHMCDRFFVSLYFVFFCLVFGLVWFSCLFLYSVVFVVVFFVFVFCFHSASEAVTFGLHGWCLLGDSFVCLFVFSLFVAGIYPFRT